MFERFTDRGRRVIVLAQEEARTLYHDYIGTEHLLLGLICEGEGVAALALQRLGLTLDGVRKGVESVAGRGPEPPTGHIPFTPRAKKVLELTLREAVQLGHHYIGTEHVLLGLIREGEGVAATVLRQQGIELSAARARVIELLNESPALVAVDAMLEGAILPRCGRCGAAVEETAAYKRVEVPGDGGAGRISVVFVFCEACGFSIGAKIMPEGA